MFIDDSRIIDVSTTPGPPSDATGVDVGRPGTVRDLPGPASPKWSDPGAVEAIAYWADTVSARAHRLSHGVHPIPGCVGCGLGGEPVEDRSAEEIWWRQAVGA